MRLGAGPPPTIAMREGEVMDFVALREYIGADVGPNLEAMAMPNNCCVSSTVIASAATQSRGHSTRPLDCFVAGAPRNDGQWHYSRSPSLNSGRLL